MNICLQARRRFASRRSLCIVSVLLLIAWGARRLGTRKPGESFRPHWAALAMATFADRESARGVEETYQYLVGSTAFHFIVSDGTVELRYGRATDPAVTVTTDEDTWADMASGKTTGSAAAAAGALTMEGDRRAAARLSKILSRRRVFAQVDHVVVGARRRP